MLDKRRHKGIYGLSGLQLQIELKKREIQPPLIFISGHGDTEMAVVYPAHLKEQEFPFRGTTLICSEYRCRPVLKISSTFQEIRFKNQGFMKTVSLLNLIH